ncbi:MAG: FecR domain-containing protein [candidate division KSB1 bacterium]|nr:FecR domain-containing protein [candidate division KSB1 bacterium]MDZ7364405.1 FecR domain-containing protein [candidate division KSB1 bacterium]MDZ7402777.1 FecR domain-containing protein [candidate division KSB1 bacterium]
MNRDDKNELLVRYFAGEATADERARVEAWRQAAAENQHVFTEFEKIWRGATEKLPKVPNVDQAWMELNAKLGLPPEQARAKILALEKPPQQTTRKVFWNDRYVWAAAAALLLALSTILYQYVYRANHLQKVMTTNAQQESVELPDGSLVKLNSGSEIQFYKNFSDSARYVNLSGEAYFEVTRDERPFYVNTGNAQIKVLGTKFGIWARNEETRVTVREGRVSLRALEAQPETVIELTANQMSLCQNNYAPAPPRVVDADHLLGWLEGKIVFDQTPLTEVIAELQRVYNVEIRLSNPTHGQHTITGLFQGKPIESVLASICLTLNLQYGKAGEEFFIAEK